MVASAVELTADDGVVLRGQRWPGIDDWVVLLHDVGPDQDLDRWRPLVPALLARAYSVLTLDLRGHGASDGRWEDGAAARDLAAALAFARTGGAARCWVVAAGQSALAALRTEFADQVDGLVLLSPGPVEEAQARELRGAGTSRLFVVGAGDAEASTAVDRLRAVAIGWSLTISLPTAAQGTALLEGPWLTHLQEHVVNFLEERRFLTRAGRPAGSRKARVRP